jgi:hypothetical protein
LGVVSRQANFRKTGCVEIKLQDENGVAGEKPGLGGAAAKSRDALLQFPKNSLLFGEMMR